MAKGDSEPMIDAKPELFKALVAAQKVMTSVTKDNKAEVRSAKGAFSYTYADLAGVIEAVKSPLAEHGLGFSQPLSMVDGQPALTTIVFHESGESLSDTIVLRGENMLDPQKMGGLISYFRRYALLAILGLATEDDDANHARTPSPATQQRQPEPQSRQQASTPQSPPTNAGGASEWVTEWSDLWGRVLRPKNIMSVEQLTALIGRYEDLSPAEVHQKVSALDAATIHGAKPPTEGRPGYQMTEKQWKTLHEVSRKKKGMDQGKLLVWASQFHPDKTLSELTVQEASEVIGELYNLPDNPNAVAVLDASGGGMGR
jgi:hypothetical protein